MKLKDYILPRIQKIDTLLWPLRDGCSQEQKKVLWEVADIMLEIKDRLRE